MYDVYALKSDAERRIVVPKGERLPSIFDIGGWTLLGSRAAAVPDIEAAVRRDGFCRYETNIPFEETDMIGSPNSL